MLLATPAMANGGAGDKISLNRPGYLAMGDAVELNQHAPSALRNSPPPKPRLRIRPAVKPEDQATPGSPG